MATASYRPQPYAAPTAPAAFGFDNTKDPRKLAASQRQVVQSGADRLQSMDEQLANQYAQGASGIEDYLAPIESQLAAGQGGYSPDEAQQIQLSGQDKSQIQLSPEDKARIQLSQGDKSQIEYSNQDINDIVNKAGITAGQRTAADVNAAERAAAASGGNPLALATYRARATQQAGTSGADAMTNARVAAKGAQSDAAARAAGLQSQGASTAAGLQTQGASTAQQLQSAGGQAVGNARIGQQNQGLGYESGLQQQKNSNALAEQGLSQGAFQTGVSGTNAAADTALKASQTPSTSDKIIGGITGALSHLADGIPNYMDDGQDAVVGENGMEAVIENTPKAVMDGAADPVRADTQYMDDGDGGGFESSDDSQGSDPDAISEIDPNQQYGTAISAQKAPNFLQSYLSKMKQNQRQPAQSGQQQWNPTTPYQQIGAAVGKIAGMLEDGTSGIGNYMADGDIGSEDEPWTDQGVTMSADGRNGMQVGNAKVFTKPTMIHLEKADSVVPLTYRPKAKVRPSAAMPAMMAGSQQRTPQYV